MTKDFYQEWPIDIQVTGTYHNLAVFFDRVARLRRLVNIGNLKVKAESRQTINNTISATCQAKTFVYVEKPIGAKPKGKKRRRR